MTTPHPAFRLRPALEAEAERIARAEGTSLDDLVNAAVAEKIAAMSTPEYFERRARLADRTAFGRMLDRAPDAEPEPWDRMDAAPGDG